VQEVEAELEAQRHANAELLSREAVARKDANAAHSRAAALQVITSSHLIPSHPISSHLIPSHLISSPAAMQAEVAQLERDLALGAAEFDERLRRVAESEQETLDVLQVG
jgi:hypothetical protein